MKVLENLCSTWMQNVGSFSNGHLPAKAHAGTLQSASQVLPPFESPTIETIHYRNCVSTQFLSPLRMYGIRISEDKT